MYTSTDFKTETTCAMIGATEGSSLHLISAQELNNSAAMCFEKGMHAEAMTSLHNGLELLIAIDHKHNCGNSGGGATSSTTEVCGCGNCNHSRWHSHCDSSRTLDECIAFSEHTSFLIHTNENRNSSIENGDSYLLSTEKPGRSSETVVIQNSNIKKNKNNADNSNCHNNCTSSKKRRLSHSRDVASGSPTITAAITADATTKTDKNGYVYQKPIHVPLEGFCDCYKGYTNLLVVIVFNLAIAHHLKTLGQPLCCDDANNKTENIAFLYRLCLDLLYQASSTTPTSSSPSPSSSSQSCASSSKASLRFEMIIHNNLSQLYRVGRNNPPKHKESLQDLLSTLMVLVEQGTRESSSTTSTSGGSSSSNNNINDIYVNYWWNNANRWAVTQQRSNNEPSELIKGVLGNLDPLILREHCADAA